MPGHQDSTVLWDGRAGDSPMSVLARGTRRQQPRLFATAEALRPPQALLPTPRCREHGEQMLLGRGAGEGPAAELGAVAGDGCHSLSSRGRARDMVPARGHPHPEQRGSELPCQGPRCQHSPAKASSSLCLKPRGET